MAKEFITELCPHCEEETQLENKFEVQYCKCGKPIIPCSICPNNYEGCTTCKLQKQVEEMNK
jgi:hypothetical protein